jgi:hypothetical protein
MKVIHRLTDEEKARMAPQLQRTWHAIGPDANVTKVRDIIEITCDANRPEEFGGMSREDYTRLCHAYEHRDTKKWLRKVLNY